MNEIKLYWTCAPHKYEGIKIAFQPEQTKQTAGEIFLKKELFLDDFLEMESWYNQFVDSTLDFNQYTESLLVWNKLEESGNLKECLCYFLNEYYYDYYEKLTRLVTELAEKKIAERGFSVEDLYNQADENLDKLIQIWINEDGQEENSLNIELTLQEAKWLDEFLQYEYKRQNIRNGQVKDAEIETIGFKIQNALKSSESKE